MMEFDFTIIGSGFGGSVSALRLSEKGYSVAVIEQGKRVTPADMEEASGSIRKLFWMPGFWMDGYFTQNFYKHLTVVGGVGVGGGSIVYAAVLLKPKKEFYADSSWSGLGIDWENELSPHYKTASKMLGLEKNPGLDLMDDYLKKTAEKMGVPETFGPTPNGIYFGRPEEMKEDPYFGGIGPSRAGCYLCGECLTGCRHGSKNSLDKNYLYLAERLGTAILSERKVTNIIPQKDGTYILKLRDPGRRLARRPDIRAKKVIISAGVLGTLELLFRCRDVKKTMPNISPQLGKAVRTNSESIVAALSPDKNIDFSHGTTISSDFYPDKHSHITLNRFPRGYNFMRWYSGPLVNDSNPLRRSLKTAILSITNPLILFKNWFAENWNKRIIVLTVMQNLDNRISFIYGRSLLSLFLCRRLKSKRVKGKNAPTYIPVANRAAAILAEELKGIPINVIMESLTNQSTTAHILGGCHMGSSPENGVINTTHEVFGYPGLYVIDGSSISANIGVNPSLTITAISERAMSLIPSKEKAPEDFLKNNIKIEKRGEIIMFFKKIVWITAIIIILNVALIGINIAQKGVPYKGGSIEQILGTPAEKAIPGDIEKLSKSEVMQLFYASPPPIFSSMKGEFRGELVPVGILSPAAYFFTHHLFGPGHWEGKAFLPEKGNGYNIFRFKNKKGEAATARTIKMKIFIGKSKIDDRESFMLDYSSFNSDIMVHSMGDEIRKINDKLYICMGYMNAGGGSINPAPFILYSEKSEYVGPDED